MWSNHKVKQYHLGERWSVLETIVQSAALYSAALISLLATYVAGSNAQYVCLDALQPIIVSTLSSDSTPYGGGDLTFYRVSPSRSSSSASASTRRLANIPKGICPIPGSRQQPLLCLPMGRLILCVHLLSMYPSPELMIARAWRHTTERKR